MITRDLLKGPESLKTYSIAVIGLGVSNIPVIRFLSQYGANITACDRKEESKLGSVIKEMQSLNVDLVCGHDYLDILEKKKFDMIVRSPGIRPDTPQFLTAIDNGAVLSSEIELVFELCACPIIGVTGSDGKTTTTSVIAEMMLESGFNAHLGGNIGTPLIEEVLGYKENDIVVLELSSFQLMTMKKSPNYSLITNLSPNHLDYHKSYQEYIDAKHNLVNWQGQNDVVVLNEDNEETKKLIDSVKAKVFTFSRLVNVSNGACLKDNALNLVEDNEIIHICYPGEMKLVGKHNIENMLAAASLARVAGASIAAIRKVATSFSAVEHRIERVRELNGVVYYNDSIASSPTRTIAGLRAFSEPIVLIAGGSDKYVPFDKLGIEIVANVKALILLGKTADKIKQATLEAAALANKTLPIIKVKSLEDAVKQSYSLAESGDIVFLSPACASFDMFKNFVERGKLFKQYVHNL